MTKLYSGGYIRVDEIHDVLERAKAYQKLPGIDERDRREFLAGFKAVMDKRRVKIGGRVDRSEVEDIIRRMELNHQDHLNAEKLAIIATVLLDEESHS